MGARPDAGLGLAQHLGVDSGRAWLRRSDAVRRFLGICVALGSKIIRATRGLEDYRWAADLASMIQVSFIGYWVGGAFLSLAYWDFPYLLVAILVLTHVVVQRVAQPASDGSEDGRRDPATGARQANWTAEQEHSDVRAAPASADSHARTAAGGTHARAPGDSCVRSPLGPCPAMVRAFPFFSITACSADPDPLNNWDPTAAEFEGQIRALSRFFTPLAARRGSRALAQGDASRSRRMRDLRRRLPGQRGCRFADPAPARRSRDVLHRDRLSQRRPDVE